jgi:hypothetical protein
MRKSKYIMVTAIILMIFIVSCNLIYSDNMYPLEAEEKLVEETMTDEIHAQIFTQLGEEFYMKKLQKDNGKWIIESVEALRPRRTGLEIGGTNTKGDRKLAAALENELRSNGLDTASLPIAVDYSQSEF